MATADPGFKVRQELLLNWTVVTPLRSIVTILNVCLISRQRTINQRLIEPHKNVQRWFEFFWPSESATSAPFTATRLTL
jgi:hypothetical protein